MNKEAELPKSIDFSQLPEAPRAFKKGKDAHSHTQARAHLHAHIEPYRQKEKGLGVNG